MFALVRGRQLPAAACAHYRVPRPPPPASSLSRLVRRVEVARHGRERQYLKIHKRARWATSDAQAAAHGDGVDTAPMPSAKQLRIFAVANAVPFIGFGAMDNFIMIQAGDIIDSTIGVALGLSTLAAAACGQVISDMCGVAFGGAIEAVAEKLGLPSPNLTAQQLQLRRVKMVGTASRVLGVFVGCLTGMLSLLFMDLDKAERERRKQELDTIFKTVVVHGRRLLHAENCRLFLLDEDGKRVYSRAEKRKKLTKQGLRSAFDAFDLDKSGKISVQEMAAALDKLGYENLPPRFARTVIEKCSRDGEVDFDHFATLVNDILLNEEILLKCGPLMEGILATGKLVNVPDLHKDDRFDPEVDKYTGRRSQALLMAPVKDQCTGKIIGFVEMLNKKGGGEFTKDDEHLIQMLCAHVAVFVGSFERR